MPRKNNLFKNKAPFRSCISKISNTFIDNAEELDIVMPMCNLWEYSYNYSIASRSLWNYYRDGTGYDENDAWEGKSFTCKTKIIEKTGSISSRSAQPPLCISFTTTTDNTEFVIPLKYLNIFWISFDLPLISCRIVLDFSWSKNCVLLK